MRITFAWLVLVLVPSLVALTGCTKDNPIYCDQNTPCMSAVRNYCDLDGTLGGVPNRCIDSGDGGRDGSVDAGCTLSSCAAATPICELAAGMCRACSTDTECKARGGTTPRCGAGAGIAGTGVEGASATASTDCTAASKPVCNATTGLCRGCQQDSECPSAICDEPTGTCAATDTIIYVTATGTDGAGCGTQASPCRTVTAAMSSVTGTRRTIHLGPGTYTEPGTVTVQSKTVVIVGRGATVKPGVISASVFVVGDNGSLTLEGVTVSDAAGSGSPRGISCNGNGTPVVRLIETTVTMNAGRGLDATNCMISIERSTLSRNQGGGLAISGTMFTIQNSFIVDNGSTGSSVGGIRIQDGSVGTMTFSTIAQNTSTASATAGVGCVGNVPTPRFRNNIVFNNLNALNVAACEWEYSDVQFTTVPNVSNNIADAPMFVDAAAGNYHLMSGSPCKDKADGAGAPMLDFDRDMRPQGGGPDIGADEIKP